VLFVLAIGGPQYVRADVQFLDIFKNQAFEQTGNGNTVSSNGYFFSADLNTSIPNSYNSAVFKPPGSAPINLSQLSTTDYHYQTTLFPTLAAMNTAFPTGTYTFTGSTMSTSDMASFDYTTDDYPKATPYLTGTDFTNLQGMNSTQAFTFHFNPDVPGTTASASYIFFTIYDETTSSYVVNDGFLDPSTTSVTVAANTLTAGDTYDYEIDYSNRDFVPSPGATLDAQLAFDVRTDGVFTTAVSTAPEPATVGLLSFSLLAGLALGRKRISPATQ
jgi:hypothetical protein